MVLLSTHETLHVKKYTLYSESNVSYILFHICGCFVVPGFELSRFYSIAAISKKWEQLICSSAIMSKFLLLLRWFLAKMWRLWNRQTVPYYFRCWWRPFRDVFPRGSPESLHPKWEFLNWRTEWEFFLCAVQFRNCPCAKWESGQSENRIFVICFVGKIDMEQRFPNFYKVVIAYSPLRGRVSFNQLRWGRIKRYFGRRTGYKF